MKRSRYSLIFLSAAVAGVTGLAALSAVLAFSPDILFSSEEYSESHPTLGKAYGSSLSGIAVVRSVPSAGIFPRAPISSHELTLSAKIVSHFWNGGSVVDLHKLMDVPARYLEQAQPIHISARSGGRRVGMFWQESSPGKETVLEALKQGLSKLHREAGAEAPSVDTLYVEFTHSYKDVSLPVLLTKDFGFSRRGALGVEVHHGTDFLRYSPSRFVETNRSISSFLSMFESSSGLQRSDLSAREAGFRTFQAEELFVQLGSELSAKLLFRGNEVVPVQAVTQENMEGWVDLSLKWFENNLTQEGKLTYLYWPSLGSSPASQENMIRQWMATVALGKYAADRKDAGLWDLSAKNIDYNLKTYYEQDGDLGCIVEWDGEVKLGALALAAMAILEHPQRDRWAKELGGLRNAVDSLWNEDGSFNTFLRPLGRNDNTNFYPGEALFFWSRLYEETKDPALLEKFMASFRYYRKWHLSGNNRNPAFVPWHTQAYYKVWVLTGDPELRDFVFEMNDWLLGVQQWEKANYPDERGQFYDPRRPFGPPHASSTGVYLEGLIDAYKMAKAVGDGRREESYRLAMVRGMRSMLQLQFVDEVDAFYVSRKNYSSVMGGLRATPWSNEIRCDNIQHPFMGILKILREFNPEDFRHPLEAEIAPSLKPEPELGPVEDLGEVLSSSLEMEQGEKTDEE